MKKGPVFYDSQCSFPYHTSWQYSDGNLPPLTGALSADGVGKIVIPEQYLASSRAVNRW